MANAVAPTFCDPSTLNLVPLPTGLAPLTMPTLAPAPAPAPAPRSDSLSRLPELNRFLLQCDQPSYYGNYLTLLQAAPPNQLHEFVKSLRQRSEWLDGQQAIEFKRMRSLQILSPALTEAITEAPPRAPAAHAPAEAAADTPAAALQGHTLVNSVTPPGTATATAEAGQTSGATENEPPAGGKRKPRTAKAKAQEKLGGKRKRT